MAAAAPSLPGRVGPAAPSAAAPARRSAPFIYCNGGVGVRLDFRGGSQWLVAERGCTLEEFAARVSSTYGPG
eukprot:2810763-Alexandrium_andersonii.AAC.1